MQTIVEYGLANAVAATLLALVVFAVGGFVRSPALRHGLWLLVFARLVLPPIWQIPLEWPTSSPVTETEVVLVEESAVEVVRGGEELPQEEDLYYFDERDPVVQDAVLDMPQMMAVEPIAAPVEDTEPQASTVEQPFWKPYLPAFAVAVWGMGTAWILCQAALRIRRFQRILKHGTPASESLQAVATEWATRMGLKRNPQIWIVPGRVWPSLWLANPFGASRVILPQGLLTRLGEDQQRAVLIHELAHLKRRDHLVRWLELIVGALYWWHPLLGWFKRQLRDSEEACCDLWVVSMQRDRKSYATALVEMVEYLNDSETACVPAPACGAGPVKHLQRRLTMIMQSKWSARLGKWGMAVVLGVGTIAFSFGPGLAIGQDTPKEEKRREGDREKPRERERPRESERNSDGEREEKRRDGDKPRDGQREEKRRDGDKPRDGEKKEEKRREGEPRDPESLEAARNELNKARAEMQKASERMRAAQERLSRLEGHPFPPVREFPEPRGRRDPMAPRVEEVRPTPPFRRADPLVAPSGPGVPGVPPFPPMAGRSGPADRAPSGELREMQKQIDELRQLLTEMRNEMKRQNDPRTK